MILPTKHIKLSNTLLCVGAILLGQLESGRTVTSLWTATRLLPEVTTFKRFTLGLDFLFMIGAVEFKDGLLRRITK
jgi:hypothetical protein